MEPKKYALRLSATAMKDYQFCGQYYRYKRVHRVPATGKLPHYLVAGSLLHNSYYYGHADPQQFGRRIEWKVRDTPQDPARSIAMFKALWNDDSSGLERWPGAVDHWHILMADKEPWNNVHITSGQRKATKDPEQAVRKAAWYDVYMEMLTPALEVELPGPIMEIERRVEYRVGETPFLGYIDIVCLLPDNTEAYLDIKTGVNKPPTEKLTFNPQMQLYYLDGPSVIYLWHFKTGMYEIERNIPLIEAMTRAVPMMVDMIEAGVFLPRNDEECGSCIFRQQCFGDSPELVV